MKLLFLFISILALGISLINFYNIQKLIIKNFYISVYLNYQSLLEKLIEITDTKFNKISTIYIGKKEFKLELVRTKQETISEATIINYRLLLFHNNSIIFYADPKIIYKNNKIYTILIGKIDNNNFNIRYRSYRNFKYFIKNYIKFHQKQ